MTLKLNSSLLLFQSKLVQPNLAGNARWELYSPYNNKGSLALGKDSFPKILSIIEKIQEDSNYISTLPEEVKNALIEAEIIIDNNYKYPIGHNYREFYRIATYNYPFRDYSRSDWFSRDVETMNQFATYGDIPSIFTDRSKLPISLKSDLEKYDFNIKGIFNSKVLMDLLYDVFTPKRLVKEGTSNPSYKTIVPSGGGKHPIEVHVINWKKMGSLEAGTYVYDIENKCLRKERCISKLSNITNHNKLVTLVFSINPCRPMWRYRDIRSFRAVFIDIGHVIEIISELLKDVNVKLTSQILPGIISFQNIFNWINEPCIAEITIWPDKEHNFNSSEHIINDYPEKNEEEIEFKTNPFTFISFENGLTLNTVFPEMKKIKISQNQFMALNHAIPSRRRDRKTSYKFLQSMVSKEELDSLIKSHGLISTEVANTLYKNITNWTNHGWYLNLLELLTLLLNKEAKNNLLENKNPLQLSNLEKLSLRETERVFDNTKLKWEDVKKIFKPVYYKKYLSEFDILINFKDKNSSSCGLYKLTSTGLSKLQKCLQSKDIRKIVVNQQYAGKSKLDILVSSTAKNYLLEEKLIILGIIGQRIISAANDIGIRAFMTPAINDKLAQNVLEDDSSAIYYYIELG